VNVGAASRPCEGSLHLALVPSSADLCRGNRLPWFILSAKYGLVAPDQMLAPYQQTLNTMPVSARREWATRVRTQMAQELPVASRIVVLAGLRYRENLIDYLRQRAPVIEIRWKGWGSASNSNGSVCRSIVRRAVRALAADQSLFSAGWIAPCRNRQRTAELAAGLFPAVWTREGRILVKCTELQQGRAAHQSRLLPFAKTLDQFQRTCPRRSTRRRAITSLTSFSRSLGLRTPARKATPEPAALDRIP